MIIGEREASYSIEIPANSESDDLVAVGYPTVQAGVLFEFGQHGQVELHGSFIDAKSPGAKAANATHLVLNLLVKTIALAVWIGELYGGDDATAVKDQFYFVTGLLKLLDDLDGVGDAAEIGMVFHLRKDNYCSFAHYKCLSFN